MMQVLWCGFLLLTHFICHVHILACDTTYEYEWPRNNQNRQCCKKCKPGERMVNRCSTSDQTVCKPCGSDFYWDKYGTEMECKRCSQCTKEYMEYKVNCTKISDAVCTCESGYKCTGNPCTECVKIPTTPPTTTTPPPTTSPPAKTSIPKISSTKNDDPKTPPLQDTVWITLSLCCVCILLTCFILISRHTPPCGWIMLASAGSFWGNKKHSAESSQCTEDEEVPMPVQEVCGKEWQEEV